MPFDPSILDQQPQQPDLSQGGLPGIDVNSIPQQPQAPQGGFPGIDVNTPPQTPQQVPQQQFQQQQPQQQAMPTSGFGGKLKDMLQRFAYFGGQAALKHVGLPTDDELQMHNAQIQNMQSEIQSRAAQIQLAKTMVTLPNGMQVPYAVAQRAFGPALTGQSRENVAGTQAGAKLVATNAALAKFGMRLNPETNQPESIPEEELSPMQRQSMAVQKAAADLADARAKGVPQEIQLKARALQQALQLGQARIGIGQQANAINAAKLGLGPLAGQVGGGSDFSDTPQFKVLSPAAQKTLMETVPVHQQIQELMQTFEPMKDDNTAGKFMKDRALYSVGIQSPIGGAADAIAQLELNRVSGAARVLKGSSRAIQALEKAMVHLPNVWIDSPKMIYSKLQNLDGALTQIESGAYQYGSKSGLTPTSNPTSSPAPSSGPKIGDTKTFPNGAKGKWDGHGWVAQ